MEHEAMISHHDKEPLSNKIAYWAQPFIKGLMFGLGHYITFKVIGPKIRSYFSSSLK